MGSQGFRSIPNNLYVYQESGISSAIGLDLVDNKFKVAVSSAGGAIPHTAPQCTIDPSVNGNINFTPNGNGLFQIGSASYPKTVALGDVLVASAANTVDVVNNIANAGYVLTVNVGAAPSFQTPVFLGIPWTEVNNATVNLAVNNGYIMNRGTLITATLPATAAQGSVIKITGMGAGGVLIAQNALQVIYFGPASTTPGVTGSLASTQDRDSLELVCVIANQSFNVISSSGNWTVV